MININEENDLVTIKLMRATYHQVNMMKSTGMN